MYARVTTVNVKTDKIDEATELYRSSVVPAAKDRDGFRGILLLTDNSTGKALSIALWESEEAMKAGETSGFLQEQYRKFGAHFSSAPEPAHYEVTVKDLSNV